MGGPLNWPVFVVMIFHISHRSIKKLLQIHKGLINNFLVLSE